MYREQQILKSPNVIGVTRSTQRRSLINYYYKLVSDNVVKTSAKLLREFREKIGDYKMRLVCDGFMRKLQKCKTCSSKESGESMKQAGKQEGIELVTYVEHCCVQEPFR